MLHICLDSDSALPCDLGIQSLLCLVMADLLDISLIWWEERYLPPFYMDSSSTLCILEFLVACIAVDWIMADGYSSAGPMVGISLSWWESWYLPLLYMDSSSTLYTD